MQAGVNSPKRGAWCFYCGRGTAWFMCDCREALEARDGKRVKPRHQRIDGQNVMILERELLDRPWNKDRLPQFRPAPTVVAAPEELASEAEDLVGKEQQRREYRKKWMRDQRAKQRGG